MRPSEIKGILLKLVSKDDNVTCPRIFLEIAGGLIEGHILKEILYWFEIKNGSENYKSDKDFVDLLYVTPYAVRKARDRFTELGWIETRVKKDPAGTPKLHYKILDKFYTDACRYFANGLCEFEKSTLRNETILDSSISNNPLSDFEESIETTATTTDTQLVQTKETKPILILEKPKEFTGDHIIEFFKTYWKEKKLGSVAIHFHSIQQIHNFCDGSAEDFLSKVKLYERSDYWKDIPMSPEKLIKAWNNLAEAPRELTSWEKAGFETLEEFIKSQSSLSSIKDSEIEIPPPETAESYPKLWEEIGRKLGDV